jgi:alkanesulfonate monooxygenase SsuD/methylene tetrahydromethanopterin reductase-like flavin-dependent oxidoreductase (luciferase family)
MRLGDKTSAEPFGPRELLGFSQLAEALGFDTVAVFDHFQPWRHWSGHAPGADQARFLDQFTADVLPLVKSNKGLAGLAPISVSNYAQ